jgi:hypothetical protein
MRQGNLSVLLAVATFAIGCGGDDDSATTPATEPPPAETTTTESGPTGETGATGEATASVDTCAEKGLDIETDGLGSCTKDGLHFRIVNRADPVSCGSSKLDSTA